MSADTIRDDHTRDLTSDAAAALAAAGYQEARAIYSQTIPTLDNQTLELVLTIVHEEHERRHGGHRWVRRVTL